jgi:hypothetical protein
MLDVNLFFHIYIVIVNHSLHMFGTISVVPLPGIHYIWIFIPHFGTLFYFYRILSIFTFITLFIYILRAYASYINVHYLTLVLHVNGYWNIYSSTSVHFNFHFSICYIVIILQFECITWFIWFLILYSNII